MDNHPNISVLQRFDLTNLSGSADVIAEDIIFHYFNPRLPELHGNHVGFEGLQAFFAKLAKMTNGTFKVNPISVTPVGDELLVVHSKNTMSFSDQDVETEVVVVWRIVNGQIVEVWDIPSIYT